MINNGNSIFEKAYDPIIQATTLLGVALLFILISKLVSALGVMEVSDRFPWMTAAAFTFIYAMFNSMFSLSSKNMLKYWGRSVYSFLGLAFGSGLMAYLFSSIPIDEAGSYRWIYIVLTIGYLIFLSMMAAMRKIVEFAQREEWNQPKPRKRE